MLEVWFKDVCNCILMVDKAHDTTCHQVCKEEEKPPLAHPADMVECDMVRDELLQTGNYGLLMATEHMAALHLGWHPASRHQASKLANLASHYSYTPLACCFANP